MPTENPTIPQPSRAAGTVPRVVWIGGAVLGLATAGIAGAMIMRSVAPAPTAPALLVPQANPQARAVSGTVPATPAAMASPATAPDTTQHRRSGFAVATTPAVLCPTCGIVESVSAAQQQAQASGLGAVAGGVVGGVVGHQFGGGSGKTAMTVLGAVGGGLAGNEVEKHARSETVFNVRVRMDDGSVRVVQQSQSWAVGARVLVDGSKLRANSDAPTNVAPQMLRTGNPSGARS